MIHELGVPQSVWLLFIKDCYRPRLSPWLLLVQCVLFFILFANFFRQAYLKKGGGQRRRATANGHLDGGVDRKTV